MTGGVAVQFQHALDQRNHFIVMRFIGRIGEVDSADRNTFYLRFIILGNSVLKSLF